MKLDELNGLKHAVALSGWLAGLAVTAGIYCALVVTSRVDESGNANYEAVFFAVPVLVFLAGFLLWVRRRTRNLGSGVMTGALVATAVSLGAYVVVISQALGGS